MTVRQYRIERGWSQIQLAEFSGLSLRTIQRIEKGRTPTVESLKALAAVFNVDFNELVSSDDYGNIDESKLDDEALSELAHIREVQRFLKELLIYLLSLPVVILIVVLDVVGVGNWLLWVLLFWGIHLAYQAFEVFDARDFLGKGWEKRILEKRLGRKVD